MGGEMRATSPEQLDRLRQEIDALIARVSRQFVTAAVESLDEVVPRALADVGQTLGFDRALIYRREAVEPYVYLWHGWLGPGVAGMGAEFDRIDRSRCTYLPKYATGEGVIVDLDDAPQNTQIYAQTKQHNVRMVAMAPLLNSGRNFGSLALHERNLRLFPDEFRRQLTLLAELFASVISRLDAEQARDRAYRELEVLKSHIERERDYLREELRGERQAGELKGNSLAMRAVLATVAAVAHTPTIVLIRGESGVGKELIARAIHEQSPRKDGPLVKVNCASIPRELFESEFFGHVRGSFTGAHKDRAGRFELADRGTLFLDEVGDIPLDLQAKLLRVLQEGEYERVGEERPRKANVRVIAATNRNLEKDLAEGRFRADLYYRLSAFPIELPPLRERGDELIELAQHFLSLAARSAGKRGLTLLPEHERLLCAYHWPGNVRELKHVIERAVILSSDSALRLDLALPKLSPVNTPPPSASATPSFPPTLSLLQPMQVTEFRQLERDNILAALEQAGWRIAGPGGAAEVLAIKPSTLRDRIRALGIERQPLTESRAQKRNSAPPAGFRT